MKPSIWTPAYLYNRLRVAFFEKRNPEAPWLTSDSITFLDAWLKRDDRVLEFGSGRSTVWLANRCHFITSVENDPAWFDAMSKKLSAFENVDYRFAPLQSASSAESPYLNVLSELPEELYDILINDGRLRCEIAIKGIAKLRPGGLHVLDNAERYLPNDLKIPASRRSTAPTADWARFIAATEDWRRVWTTNGITATLLMFKPC